MSPPERATARAAQPQQQPGAWASMAKAVAWVFPSPPTTCFWLHMLIEACPHSPSLLGPLVVPRCLAHSPVVVHACILPSYSHTCQLACSS